MQSVIRTKAGGGLCNMEMDRCYKWQYLYKVPGKCFIGDIYRNIVQYCAWYNQSIRIRYSTFRHTGTCILSAFFISRRAIFSRSGPHGRVDCLDPFSAPCASLSSFLKHTATITQAGLRVRHFDPEPSLLSFALRHWCRVYICISKGDHDSFLSGWTQHAGTSPPWVKKQGNYRICL